MPASEWMLEIGAFFMRTETELILKVDGLFQPDYLKQVSGLIFQIGKMLLVISAKDGEEKN